MVTVRDQVLRWIRPAPSLDIRALGLERSPGARLLLREAERSAQLALHVLRGLLWLAAILPIGLSADVPLAIKAFWSVGLGLTWVGMWRLLAKSAPPGWLRYALVYLDGGYVLEYLLAASGMVPQLAVLVPTGAAHEVVTALAAPLLVFLAISGVFRIDPVIAALSAVVAVGTYVVVAITMNIPSAESVPTGLVIAFTGAAGMIGARVIRDAVLRAGEARILEHYVPGSLLGELMRTGGGANGTEEDVTLLLADIRGFTSAVESLPPASAVAFLNDYLAAAIPPLLAEGAVVDKYLGDGVLAFMQGEAQAQRALRAATALLDAAAGFDSPFLRSRPLRVGVAVHTGRAMLGSIGPASRREYTIISDAVNVTSRLEELNKRLGSAMIVTDSVLAAGGELPDGFVGPEEVELRGHQERMEVYYLPEAASIEGAEKKVATSPLSASGLESR